MKKKIKVGSDFSGVGAFDQALLILGIDYETEFACDMDKYARTTYIHNYGEPKYYPQNVYDREIPSESLDIYMTSPPCQAFSLAGKRLGKDDKRGILFFNSHEFITKNKPRFFIFENVKGLLSDDNGKTFQEWVNLLGGKSVNGLPILFAYEDSVPYHIYWKVLNAKEHGVPQNRERVFIIGIRDDQDNNFRFPVEEHLTKRLKDVLENEVNNKYFLSDKGIEHIIAKQGIYTGINEDPIRCLTTRYSASLSGTFLKVKSANSKGYEIAEEGDSINYSFPNSKTRQGRVGKQVAQTLDTACNQGVVYNDKRLNETIQKHELPKGEIKILDTYNQSIHDYCPTLKKHHAENGDRKLWDGYKIRRLTPRECFRLMDFPDSFDFSCVSDSQAYKQAGNSIVVRVLEKIIKNLSL
jgi:DNA (cytosine-5)-methyltransferase 1